MNIASIGIDLGKTTFHLVALGERNKILLRRKFSRSQLLAYTANLPASLIGLEACAGSHFIGTVLREQGHQVRLIPAQFVKPYRKSNKNDFIDAEAIAEAVTKQNMRFVQIKTQEQLDWQAMHRVRDRLMQRCTALINEIRGFLLERGLTFALGKHRTLSTFPPPRRRSFEVTFHQGLLRREEDERTVQRRVGKPDVDNASLVTERFIRTDTRGSSSSARRAILH